MDLRRLECLGILLLPISAWTVVAATMVRGHMVLPGDSGFAEFAASRAFEIWGSASLNATVWTAFGLLALACWLRHAPDRSAVAWGTFLSLAGILVFLPVTGVIRMQWPVAGEAALPGTRTQSRKWRPSWTGSRSRSGADLPWSPSASASC